MSKGDPTAAKANKELGEQGHLVRENIIKWKGNLVTYLNMICTQMKFSGSPMQAYFVTADSQRDDGKTIGTKHVPLRKVLRIP